MTEGLVKTMKEWTVAADIDNIPVIAEQIGRELETLNSSRKALRQIQVSVDELLTNIASYAYAPGTGMVTVQMAHDAGTGMVSITFIDSGVPYNPLEHEDPDVTLGAEERPVGGLGILIVKSKMDSVDYRYEDGKNILTIRKRIREE